MMIPGLVQTNAVENGSNVETDLDRGNRPLARALTRIFSHPDDRVFWELSPGDQGVVLGRSCIAAAGGTLRPVAAGYGLATALGASYAQQKLVQDNWVVAALDGPLLIDSLNPRATEQLRNSHRRLILVLCEPADQTLRLPNDDELRERLERLGTPVLGPVDESDEELLAEHLRFARRLQRPAIVRVRTTDVGMRALESAEDSRQARSPQRASRVLQEVLDSELLDLGKSHAHLMLLSFGNRFEFPNFAADCSGRYFEAAAAEPDALVWCRGLAAGGCTPFVITDAEGLNQGWDGITREWEGEALPLCLVVTEGELPSAGRRSVLARLRQLPNAIVLSPANRGELRDMLRIGAESAGITAIHVSPDTPWLHPLGASENTVEVGRGALLIEGCDVALIAVGSAVATAVRAADELSSLGCSTAVLNVRSVAPLDAGLIAATARGVERVVVVEERSSRGGLGSAILELLSEEDVCRPVTLFATSSSPHLSSGRIADELVERVLALQSGSAPAQREADFGITGDSLRTERSVIEATELTPTIRAWCDAYATAGQRNEYLWKWVLHGVRLITLPMVDPKHFDHVCETKLLAVIIGVLVDDVADHPGREDFLDLLLSIVSSGGHMPPGELDDDQRAYAGLVGELVREYHARLSTYPCYAAFCELLRYDDAQQLNTMRYSNLLNRQLQLLNPTEGDVYSPHGMQIMSFATIDLMCASEFPVSELGSLREVVWHFQCMGRIGNLLSTWRREIPQRDFTSGLFALALAQGALTLQQLDRADGAEIEAAIHSGDLEQHYFRRWRFHRDLARRKLEIVKAFDGKPLQEGHDRVFLAHLASRGVI